MRGRQRGLGKGLGALIPGAEARPGLAEVSVDDIDSAINVWANKVNHLWRNLHHGNAVYLITIDEVCGCVAEAKPTHQNITVCTVQLTVMLCLLNGQVSHPHATFI